SGRTGATGRPTSNPPRARAERDEPARVARADRGLERDTRRRPRGTQDRAAVSLAAGPGNRGDAARPRGDRDYAVVARPGAPVAGWRLRDGRLRGPFRAGADGHPVAHRAIRGYSTIYGRVDAAGRAAGHRGDGRATVGAPVERHFSLIEKGPTPQSPHSRRQRRPALCR